VGGGDYSGKCEDVEGMITRRGKQGTVVVEDGRVEGAPALEPLLETECLLSSGAEGFMLMLTCHQSRI
jgi:hypothetical protein